MILLKELLEEYGRFRLASTDDNEEILEFFTKVPMETGDLVLRYDRSPDYFSFISEQGIASFTILFLNDDKSIGGMSGCSIRNCYNKAGEQKIIAYFGDLRIAPTLSKRTRVKWRKLYQEIINRAHEIYEMHGAEIIYTAILSRNEAATNALTGPKSKPRYVPLCDYQTINILGTFPLIRRFRKSSSARFETRRVTSNDFFELKEFLVRENKKKVYGDFFESSKGGGDELSRRVSCWHDFDLFNFVIVRDKKQDNKIVACTCLWHSNKARRLVVEKVSLFYKLLGIVLPVFGSLPFKVGEALRVLYLTHLEVSSDFVKEERQSLVKYMINYIYKTNLHKGHHLLTMMDFGYNSYRDGMDYGYIVQTTPGTLYQVITLENFESDNFIKMKSDDAISFEISIA